LPSLLFCETLVATDLSDTSLVVGVSETNYGHEHAFEWTVAGGTVDLGVLPGGNNSAVGAISRNGAYGAGTSEVGGHTSESIKAAL
jgi:probable HAF family extracellular repeat protein